MSKFTANECIRRNVQTISRSIGTFFAKREKISTQLMTQPSKAALEGCRDLKLLHHHRHSLNSL